MYIYIYIYDFRPASRPASTGTVSLLTGKGGARRGICKYVYIYIERER